MKKAKKAIASLAIAGMALSMIPFNALATGAIPSRIGGYTAAQTAVQIADQTGWTGSAILSSSTSYGMVDALTVGPLAAFLKAPILLQDAGNRLNAETEAELTKLKVKTVYVTSGIGVISQGVLNQLQGMGITVVPLGGFDRFETSVNIAEKMIELGAQVDKVAIAYGWQNQDALSIASIASAQTEPILLTEKDTLPASVKEFLANTPSVKSVHVIGGTGVISEAVKAQLPGAARYFGYTAYDTNVAVLKAFESVLKYDYVFIANGETGIDSLAGAPLAAMYNAGIVLTNGAANEGTTYMSSKLSADSVVTALGGTAVVPETVRLSVKYVAPEVPVDPVVPPSKPSSGGGGGGGGGGGSNTTVSKTALTAAINSATTLIESTAVGREAGNVSQAAHAAFQTAITAATNVLNNTKATKAQVTAQETALAAAVSTFNNEIILGIGSQAEADIISSSGVISRPIAVTGSDITITSATSDFDLVLKGNNITLQNLTVNGTVYVDPGDTGTATLRNVTATNIVVLSGAPNSIYLEAVIAQLLSNQSSSPDTHLRLSGGSDIQETTTTSSATFEAADGSFGTIKVTKSETGEIAVELIGTFSEDIVTGGGVSITATPGTVVPNLVVAAARPGETVTLNGSFQSVEVNGQANTTVATGNDTSIANLATNSSANINLGANTTISQAVTNSSTNFSVPTGSTVSNVLVATAEAGQEVSFEGTGTIGTVEVNSRENVGVTLGAGTTVTNVVTNTTADIFIAPSSSITTIDTGNTGSTTSGGGTIVSGTMGGQVVSDLVTQIVNKSALATAITNATTLLGSKTVGNAVGNVSQTTYAAFQAAISAATAVNSRTNATQAQVDAQVGALGTASTAFNNGVITQVAANKTGLTAALTSATALLGSKTVGTAVGNVPQAAYNALQAAINEGKVISGEAYAPQAQVDAQAAALNAAMSAFNRAVITTPPVTKEALTAAIDSATSLLVLNVPQAAREALLAAISSARTVKNNALATQAQVDAEVTALGAATTAFNNAVIKADKTALTAAISEATALIGSKTVGTALGNVPQAAKDAFQAAITAATAVKNDANATQGRVDIQVAALGAATTAFNNAVIKEVSKTALTTAINNATTLMGSKTVGTAVGNVPQAAKDAFQAAITAATAVNNNVNATQAQVDAQIMALEAATTAFNNAVIKEVNKTALTTAISNATALMGSKTVGTAVGNVPQAAKTAFQAAITAATAVKDNVNATQAQVDAQVTALAAATTAFNNSVIPAGPIVTNPGPKVTSITSSSSPGTTIAHINESTKVITITPIASAFKQPNVQLDQAATMKITVDRSGTRYTLGSWNLTSDSAGNDIFSAANALNLDIMTTLQVLLATGITSSQIFEAVNFNALLTASETMTPANKAIVYENLANLFEVAQGTTQSTEFYEALNLPGVYAAADWETQESITTIINNAIPAGAIGTVSAAALLAPETSATQVKYLSDHNYMEAFYSGIDFHDLISDLSQSTQKNAMFEAVNFTALFNAVNGLDNLNKYHIYICAAHIYQAALTVSAGSNAINYGALLQMVTTSPNIVEMSLKNTQNVEKTYTLVTGVLP